MLRLTLKDEAELLLKINQGIPPDLQERYNELIIKGQNLTQVGVGFRAETQPTATQVGVGFRAETQLVYYSAAIAP